MDDHFPNPIGVKREPTMLSLVAWGLAAPVLVMCILGGFLACGDNTPPAPPVVVDGGGQ